MPQENNMAEVLRLLKTVIVKVDDLSTDLKDVKADVQVLKTDVHVLKTDVHSLNAKVDHLTGRFDSVAHVVIKDTQRLTSLENRVDILEGKTN